MSNKNKLVDVRHILGSKNPRLYYVTYEDNSSGQLTQSGLESKLEQQGIKIPKDGPFSNANINGKINKSLGKKDTKTKLNPISAKVDLEDKVLVLSDIDISNIEDYGSSEVYSDIISIKKSGSRFIFKSTSLSDLVLTEGQVEDLVNGKTIETNLGDIHIEENEDKKQIKSKNKEYSYYDIKIKNNSYETSDGLYHSTTDNGGYSYWYDKEGARLGSKGYDYFFINKHPNTVEAAGLLNKLIKKYEEPLFEKDITKSNIQTEKEIKSKKPTESEYYKFIREWIKKNAPVGEESTSLDLITYSKLNDNQKKQYDRLQDGFHNDDFTIPNFNKDKPKNKFAEKFSEPKNLRSFEVKYLEATGKSGVRIKIIDNRFKKSVTLSRDYNVSANEQPVQYLNSKGIKVIYRTELNSGDTLLLSDNFQNQIK